MPGLRQLARGIECCFVLAGNLIRIGDQREPERFPLAGILPVDIGQRVGAVPLGDVQRRRQETDRPLICAAFLCNAL